EDKPEPEEQKKAEVVIEVPPPPAVDQTKFTVIEIKEDKVEQKPLVENVEIEQKETAVAAETKQGEAASNVVEEVKVVEEPGKDLKEAGTGEEDANKVYNEFEVVKNADYPGGINAFRKALQEKIKYPSQATRKGTEGTVTISFVIDKDGKITDAKVIKDIGDGCGDAALEALKQMTTPWSPATDAKGKAVKVRKTLPVKFTLPK
ncbi:MAG: TonB family protein, partial [Raineya sp.]|nr:TonB family protein [Raineya sp.]